MASNVYVFILVALTALACSCKQASVHNHNKLFLASHGVTSTGASTPVALTSSEFKTVDAFVRKNVKDLKAARPLSASSQNAGTSWTIIYRKNWRLKYQVKVVLQSSGTPVSIASFHRIN